MDRLTDMAFRPGVVPLLKRRHESLSTSQKMSSIIPAVSAMGMNSDGGMYSPSSFFTSASAEQKLPSSRQRTG